MTTEPEHKMKMGRVLVVAGSDCISGAGLQVDLKTITALGGYAMTAVTAVTIQDTQKVYRILPVEPEWVAEQMQICLKDVGADCIKLGMLVNVEIVRAVVDVLKTVPQIPVVADPVLIGSGGGVLLDAQGLELFVDHLLPRLSLLTPNLPEATALTRLHLRTLDEIERAARVLGNHRRSILIKGGHGEGETLVDVLFHANAYHHFSHQRQMNRGVHGTGCALASAIATGLAQKMALPAAVARGIQFVQMAIRSSYSLGKGQRLLAMPGPIF
ncbi:MAG: bifunctional hydroxymethylpyrimidine kinase/phosphomethylpyrimidine kinase [Magnetococcus sp. DMHC-6]